MIEYAQIITALVTFGYASWTDIKSRRVENWVWTVSSTIGVVLIALNIVFNFRRSQFITEYVITVAASILILSAMGISFYYLGFFGGADGKALITLGILLPVYPTISVFESTLPVYTSEITIFSLAVLMNGLILTLFYPILLGLSNGKEILTKFPYAFVYKRVNINDVSKAHGKLLIETDGKVSLDGMDLDTLRMYLEWRDITFEQLRNNSHYYRVVPPKDGKDVGDGRVTDVLMPTPDDAWGAKEFCDENHTYGTTPEQLQNGLSELTTSDNEVIVMPGIPLIVSFFVGIISAVTFGDIITAFLIWLL